MIVWSLINIQGSGLRPRPGSGLHSSREGLPATVQVTTSGMSVTFPPSAIDPEDLLKVLLPWMNVNFGHTLLGVAAVNNNEVAFRMLSTINFEENPSSHLFGNALHAAALLNDVEMFKVLQTEAPGKEI